MASVSDEKGEYLGEGQTPRDNAKAFILHVLTQDQALRFEVFNHFKTLENPPLDVEVIG